MSISAVNSAPSVVREAATTNADASKALQVSQMAKAPKALTTTASVVSRSELEESVRSANERLAGRNQQVTLGVDQGSGTVIVTVTDATSGRVIRQIPSEEALRITRSLDELTGILVDKKE